MLVRNNAGRADLRAYLGDRAFYTKIAQIAIPIMLQSLITVGINMMDTIMLGSMGETQLSASALANQFINVFHIFCMGIGMGASVLTARFWGMEDLPSLRQAVTIMLRLVTAFALLFTIATILTPTGILWIYTKDAEIIEYGAIYLRWLIPTYLCMGLSLTCTIVLRSVGQVQIPLISSILAFFINVFFNWVFIFGRLGAPRMEIAGAALDTFWREPLPQEDPLLSQQNLLLTPHIAADSLESRNSVSVYAAKNIVNVLNGTSMEGKPAWLVYRAPGCGNSRQ